jgi:hypothetical protein
MLLGGTFVVLIDMRAQGDLAWQKARASQGFGMCVEVAPCTGGVAFRHSVTPEDGAILYSHAEFRAFVDGVRKGEFDHLL